jgi:hypothetical protein
VVEHDLAKVGVEGSNPFARSRFFILASLTKARCKAGLSFLRSGKRIRGGLAETRGARFSPAADVIAFDGLIHLTADQITPPEGV